MLATTYLVAYYYLLYNQDPSPVKDMKDNILSEKPSRIEEEDP